MERNIGIYDSYLRLMGAVFAVIIGLFAGVELIAFLSFPLVITAVTSWSPLYTILKKSTCTDK